MIEWNIVKYIDCMDEKEGLPSLPDKSIDLSLTDPPFNINLKEGTTINKDKIFYSDNKKDYWNWCKEWFNELNRICSGVIIYIMKKHLPNWINIRKPRDYAFVIKRNAQSGGSRSYWQRVSILLFYGKTNKIKEDYFETYSFSGFLREGFIHPCPLIPSFWNNLISQLKTNSVIDPFMGSGTTAEICTKLGIKWFGYEINEVYKQDIELRLKNCKKEPKQIELKLN